MVLDGPCWGAYPPLSLGSFGIYRKCTSKRSPCPGIFTRLMGAPCSGDPLFPQAPNQDYWSPFAGCSAHCGLLVFGWMDLLCRISFGTAPMNPMTLGTCSKEHTGHDEDEGGDKRSPGKCQTNRQTCIAP